MTHIANIYISYSAHDTATQQRLQHDLQNYGFAVESSINDEALFAANYLFVLLSPEAVYSRTVKTELTTAWQMRKPIYPLLVRGEAEEITPVGFKPHQWYDMRSDATYKRNLSTLLAIITRDLDISIDVLPTLPSTPDERQELREWVEQRVAADTVVLSPLPKAMAQADGEDEKPAGGIRAKLRALRKLITRKSDQEAD